MPAPGVYLLALMLYVGAGFLFCLACLLLAVFPKTRSASLRAAACMIATYPGVFLYQLISLPLMAVLLVVVTIGVSVLDMNEHPNVVLGVLVMPVAAFGGVSLAGFISGWRIARTALVERSMTAGLRKDLLVTCCRRLWKRDGTPAEPAVASAGDETRPGGSSATENPS